MAEHGSMATRMLLDEATALGDVARWLVIGGEVALPAELEAKIT